MPTTAKIYLLIACFLWAISFIATKVALESTPPLTVASLRLLVASFCFLAWFIWRKKKVKFGNVHWWLTLIALSLVGMGHYGVQTAGLQFTSASNASLYAITAPISILILGALFLREKISLKKILGISLAVCGVLTVMGLKALLAFELQEHLLGDLLVLTSIAMWGAFTVFGKKMTDQLGALLLTALTTFIGAIWMIPVAWGEMLNRSFSLTQITTAGWLAITFLGVSCTFLATLLYFIALQKTESQKVGVYLYTIPPMTALIAAFYLGESLGLNLLIGSALVFTGVYLTERG